MPDHIGIDLLTGLQTLLNGIQAIVGHYFVILVTMEQVDVFVTGIGTDCQIGYVIRHRLTARPVDRVKIPSVSIVKHFSTVQRSGKVR